MHSKILPFPTIDYSVIGYRKEVALWQLKDICPYCGCVLDSSNITVDHIPSKALIDKPYPPNLAAIPCCQSCNRSFSSDEEYASVLLECVKHQSFNPNDFSRKSIQRTVLHTPSLMETVRRRVLFESKDKFTIAPDDDRFKMVLLKLVKAHLRFEDSLFLISDDNIRLSFYNINSMPVSDVTRFLTPFSSTLLPEVGSRALESAMVIHGEDARLIRYCSPWISYQKDTYLFCVASTGDKVKILLHDYLCVYAELVA